LLIKQKPPYSNPKVNPKFSIFLSFSKLRKTTSLLNPNNLSSKQSIAISFSLMAQISKIVLIFFVESNFFSFFNIKFLLS